MGKVVPFLLSLWTFLWGGATLVFLWVALADWTGIISNADNDAAAGGVMLALMTGAVTAHGIFRLRRLRADRRPRRKLGPSRIRSKRHPLPGAKSVAREPMRQLNEAEATLAKVLRKVAGSPEASAVPPDSVDAAWRTATEAAAELRAVAVKAEAVELAVEQAAPDERADLEAGIRRLRERLDQGLDGYRGLIAAAGQVLIASASGPAGEELTDATERLAGLAQALHELSALEEER